MRVSLVNSLVSLALVFGLGGLGCSGSGGEGTGGGSAAGGGTTTGGGSATGGGGASTGGGGGSVPGDSLTQFLSYDGLSGPTRGLWSTKLQLPWVHKNTGDYLDAELVSQGTKPFASGTVSAPGPVSIKVESLVARWLTTGVNRGFYLRSNEDWPFTFVGRTGAAASAPKLTIVTDKGTFTPPCRCNANWSTSSDLPTDTRASFKVSKALTYSIVQFDLSGVTGTVQSATLSLVCTEAHTAGTMDVFEANPPAFHDGGGGSAPVLGIAKGFKNDKNITTSPDVLFAADFSDLGKTTWQSGDIAVGYKQEPDGATGTTILHASVPKGELLGCSLERNVIGATAQGIPDKVETELYARYYVWLDDDWGSTVDANKMPGWDGRFGYWNPVGYWQSTTGNGGTPGTGLKVWNAASSRWEYQGCSMRGHGGLKYADGNPYDDLFWIGGYIYHLDQPTAYGEPVKWTGFILGKGKWYSIEHHIKMNTIAGPFDANQNGTANPDGEYDVWVDGVPAYARHNFRWRRHSEMGIQGFWLNWYHGGTLPPLTDMHFRMNSVVVARKYIGPRTAD